MIIEPANMAGLRAKVQPGSKRLFERLQFVLKHEGVAFGMSGFERSVA